MPSKASWSEVPFVLLLSENCGAQKPLASKIREWIGSGDRPVFALLMDKFGNETSPARLVRRTQPGTRVAMKIFMEPIAIAVALFIECFDRGA